MGDPTSPLVTDTNQGTSTVEDDIREDQAQLERIVFLRSLASNGPGVEKLMEALIVITGHWKGDTPLNLRDHAAMDELEAKLRHYLIHEDPAHAFTAESLDERLIEHATPSPPASNKPYGRLLIMTIILAVIAVLLYLLVSIL